MRCVSIALAVSIILLSCSGNTWIKNIPLHQKYENDINYLGENRSGKITLINESEIQTQELRVAGDSIFFVIEDEAKQNVISMNDVKKITFKDHTIGLFYGIIGGVGVGVATGYVSIDWDAEMAGLGMLLYMGVGILTGGIYGGITGADLNYIMPLHEK